MCVSSITTNVQSSGDSLGKITWEIKDFLSQGKISDVPIVCARDTRSYTSEHFNNMKLMKLAPFIN